MEEKTTLLETWAWLFEICIGIAVVIGLSFALKKIVHVIQSRSKKKEGVWSKKARHIFHLPLQIAIWGFGLAYVLDVAGTHLGLPGVAKYIRPLRGAFLVACFGWIILRWVKEAFAHLAKRSEKLGVAPSTVYALSKLSSFVISIIVLIIILQIFDLNVVPLLTFGGIGVAGVAFAAQDIIANFFGGAMLHFTRNFSVNDQVVIPSQNNFEGIVKEIGWYVTVIVDYSRRPVYFPNSVFSKTHVINASRRTHRRVKETVVIRYDDLPKLETIVAEMQQSIAAHPQVDSNLSFAINFNKFGDHGLEIYIYLLVFQSNYAKFLQTQQELLMIAKSIVEKHGAQFCYPTMRVQLEQPKEF